MRISLCIIAGNESTHIIRLLESFGPAFDELSLVRAIGNQTPDNTVDLASEWCEKHEKLIRVADYKNDPLNNWPHVDNFSAARNKSFEQATGDWLLWADCDDVIDDAAAIREIAQSAPDSISIYRFPYDIPQSGKSTIRERLIRGSIVDAGRVWHWPVHENFLIQPGDRWENLSNPTWIHKPEGPKAGGERRNLKILTGALRDAPAHYYYCHQENFYLRKLDESQRFGKIFLSLPGSPIEMKYQCLLNMAEMADKKEEASTFALCAHWLFPDQKEAIASLVKCSFQDEHFGRALHWSKILMKTPAQSSEKRLWCYEPKWDGWAAADLRRRSLRYAGLPIESSVLPLAPAISLLHATRNRANQAIQCRDLWLELADHPELIEHIFAFDADDKTSQRWLRSFQHVKNPGNNCVGAWNLAAKESKAPILVQLSDDWLPCRGWDTLILKAAGDRTDQFVIAVNDGHRKDDLLCMAILSRARWEAQGQELFSTEYQSMFSDNEFSFRAYRDGVVIDARNNIALHHQHPAFGAGEWDETYRRQNAPEKYQSGIETYNRRNPDAPQLSLTT